MRTRKPSTSTLDVSKLDISKLSKLDISRLPVAQRQQINKILNPRNAVFSQRFKDSDIASWRSAAKAEGKKINEWVELYLNAAAMRHKK